MAKGVLPVNVRTLLLNEQAQAQTHLLVEGRANFQTAGNYLRLSAAKSTDEPSPQSARAIDKVLRLPKNPTP